MFTSSQWLTLYESIQFDAVDYPAVLLAFMCLEDPRLDDCDDILDDILDTMSRDTVSMYLVEIYSTPATGKVRIVK